MSTKQLKQDTIDTLKGFKKIYNWSLVVIEAFAWLGLIATGVTLTAMHIWGHISLAEWQLAGVAFSTFVVLFRAGIELGSFARKLGRE